MGAFCLGTAIGYSSSADAILKDYPEPALNLTDGQISWFSSTLNLGALMGGTVGGFIIKSVGRRGAVFYSLIPWTLGWALIGRLKHLKQF